MLEALEMAIELRDGHFEEGSYKLLSDMYIKAGDYKNAIDLYKKYKQISDSLQTIEKSKELTMLQVKYELESKEKEIIREKEEQMANTRQKTILYGTVGGFLFLVILLTGFIIYQRNRARFTKNLIFSEQKALRAQMNPHFIFNSLGSIQNFILSKDTDVANDYLTGFGKCHFTRIGAERRARKIRTRHLKTKLPVVKGCSY